MKKAEELIIKKSPSSLDAILSLVVTLIVLGVTISAAILAVNFIICESTEDIFERCLDSYYEMQNNEDENLFLNVDSSHKQSLIKAIIDNSDISIADVEHYASEEVAFIVDIKVPSFAASLERRFPQLFTYSNVSYVDLKLNAMSENEYIDMVFSTVASDMINPTIYYCNKVIITAMRSSEDSEKWVIQDISDFENHFLGNIYSYQNDDVHFLTFKDLILPSTPSLQTSTSEVSALFTDASPTITYSSPDILIPMGDSARFSGALSDDNVKANFSLSVNAVQKNEDNTISVTFKGCTLTPETEITLPANLFGSYLNGRFIEALSKEDVTLTNDISTFQIIINSPADSVVFNNETSPLYFSLVQ